MNPLRLEGKRLLYSLWMLPAILAVTAGLAWLAYRGGVYPRRGSTGELLSQLLSASEYHILLYAVLAAALAGVDVSARIPELETLAGSSRYRFLRRKAVLFCAAVLLCEMMYCLVPVLLWRIPAAELPASLTWAIPVRLFLDLGIALPFFLLQTALPDLQVMLIADAMAAILWVGLHEDDLSAWYQALCLGGGLPGHWFLLGALSIVLSLAFSFLVPRLRR